MDNTKELVGKVIKIGNIELEHPIMNAAGISCRTLEEIEELAKTPVSAVVMGSITENECKGNEKLFFEIEPEYLYSLNSLGIPNAGWHPYYHFHASKYVNIVHSRGKPLIISVASLREEDHFHNIVTEILESSIDAVEINLGCPNHSHDSLSYHYRKVSSVFESLALYCKPELLFKRIHIKFAPMYSLDMLINIACLCRAYQWMISAVVTTNTIPNALWSDGFTLAGMGGKAIKPIGLGQVKQFRKFLPEEISIIGVGGIYTGRDVQDYLDAGASAVQIGTAHAIWGPKIFDRILMAWAGGP